MANPKCAYCGKIIKNEPYTIKISRKNVHYCNEDCCKKHERLKKDRNDYLDYVQSIYVNQGYDKNSINWNILTAQTKNLMDENKDWTYAQMKYTLWYMNEVEHVNLFSEQSNGSILSLLSFYFTQSKEFCLKQREIINAVKEFDFKDEVVKIHKNTEEDELYLDDLSFD